MLRTDGLQAIEVPEGLAEFSFSRVQGLLKEYSTQQEISNNRLKEFPRECKYDLKWLALSCHLQGISDASQVLNQSLEAGDISLELEHFGEDYYLSTSYWAGRLVDLPERLNWDVANEIVAALKHLKERTK